MYYCFNALHGTLNNTHLNCFTNVKLVFLQDSASGNMQICINMNTRHALQLAVCSLNSSEIEKHDGCVMLTSKCHSHTHKCFKTVLNRARFIVSM